MAHGREYWISAWVNENENGKYFSLSFKPKTDARPASGSPQLQAKVSAQQPYRERTLDDDSIPF